MDAQTAPRRRSRTHAMRVPALLLIALIAVAALFAPAGPDAAFAGGSNTLYPAGSGTNGFRANIEWRTSNYAGAALKRRTLIFAYVKAGEYIQVASSAVGISRTAGGVTTTGDIFIYNPGLIDIGVNKEKIGQETLTGQNDPLVPSAANASFSCLAQRAANPGIPGLGQIRTRAQELAGPKPSANSDAYDACFYRAPVTGIYNIIFTGPAGSNSDLDLQPSGVIESPTGGPNFGPEQGASVSTWDVTIRAANASGGIGEQQFTGRLFAYYISAITGGNNRPLYPSFYTVTNDGYRYRIDLRGLDPWGFILFANSVGFFDSDGVTPLYHDIMADPTCSTGTNAQNQLTCLQGGVSVQRPEFPIFAAPPDNETLTALGIPLEPVVPDIISDLKFVGTNRTDNKSVIGTGGAFSYTTKFGTIDLLVISRDGQNFDPTNPQNATIYGRRQPGPQTILWDGLDNSGVPFPVGTYRVKLALKGGEIHFPILDAENSTQGGPTFTLLNPVNGVCPPGPNGTPLCTAAYYDDRGYRTLNNTVVGEVNGPLCPGNPGGPPAQPVSGLVTGPTGVIGLKPFDSASTQRAYGLPGSLPSGGNAGQNCSPNGSFGDTKGLDIWAAVPGEQVEAELEIIESATAITLSDFSATRQGDAIAVRWTTGAEIDSFTFRIWRSTDGRRANAEPVAEIPARGKGGAGASYEWIDRSLGPGKRATYWLQEIDVRGQVTEYGPARGGSPNDWSGVLTFLPRVQ
jgi:hypothetical protein